MIKVVAVTRGWRHFSHAELRVVIRNLYQETGDEEYVSLFSTAERLHANFYEDFIEADSIDALAGEAVRLVEKLQVTALGTTS